MSEIHITLQLYAAERAITTKARYSMILILKTKTELGPTGIGARITNGSVNENYEKTPRKNVQKFNQRTRKKYLIIPNTLPALMASHRKLWDKNILYTCWNNKNLVKPTQSVRLFLSRKQYVHFMRRI